METPLHTAENQLGLSSVEAARFFGYSKAAWSEMRAGVHPIPPRLEYSIEAHLRLPKKTIDQLKKERLR